jgi:threonyl-tRNA synthetase
VAFPEGARRLHQRVDEAKKRDHRKLGQELELFMFHDGRRARSSSCPRARSSTTSSCRSSARSTASAASRRS